MKLVTSLTVFNDAVGMRFSVTYSEVDENGRILSNNVRTDRVITDAAKKKAAQSLLDYAQTLIDAE